MNYIKGMEQMETEIMNDTVINLETGEISTDPNMLQRAKDQGLKVTPDGRIILPGTLKNKKEPMAKKEKTPKTPKVKKEVVLKEFKGISSKIKSSGDTLDKMIVGLTIISDTIKANKIDSPYKVSTYKDELRIAFETTTATKMQTLMPESDVRDLEKIGMTIPEKKEFFAMKIV